MPIGPVIFWPSDNQSHARLLAQLREFPMIMGLKFDFWNLPGPTPTCWDLLLNRDRLRPTSWNVSSTLKLTTYHITRTMQTQTRTAAASFLVVQCSSRTAEDNSLDACSNHAEHHRKYIRTQIKQKLWSLLKPAALHSTIWTKHFKCLSCHH